MTYDAASSSIYIDSFSYFSNSHLDRLKALRGWHLPSYARILFVWFVGADIAPRSTCARGLSEPISERGDDAIKSSDFTSLH